MSLRPAHDHESRDDRTRHESRDTRALDSYGFTVLETLRDESPRPARARRRAPSLASDAPRGRPYRRLGDVYGGQWPPLVFHYH
eukprot:2898285-Prymnesium_polylepis.2